jgi:hypothetical protein
MFGPDVARASVVTEFHASDWLEVGSMTFGSMGIWERSDCSQETPPSDE